MISLTDCKAYVNSSEKYRRKTEKVLAKSDVFILSGFNTHIDCQRGALVLKQGATNGEETTETVLNKGVHHILIL
jgi:hypothetical protein